MSQIPKITDREWLILKLFIVEESFVLLKNEMTIHQKNDPLAMQLEDHFYSYPDAIVKKLTRKYNLYNPMDVKNHSELSHSQCKDILQVKTPTARAACRHFTDIGIFKRVEGERAGKKNQETTKFFLKPDFKTFKTVLSIVKERCPDYYFIEMLSFPYLSQFVNENLVRLILSERDVSILGRIDILDWKPDEILKAFRSWEANETLSQNDLKSHIQDSIRDFEKHSVYQKDVFRWTIFPAAQTHIPIQSREVSDDERKYGLEKIIQEEERLNQTLRQYPSPYYDHTRIVERELLIFPILALIQSSPEALSEFVLGDWSTFQLQEGFIKRNNEAFRNELFGRLITRAMMDVGRTMLLPHNSIVEEFFIRNFPSRRSYSGEDEKEDALIMIRLSCGYEIYYDLTFSTTQIKTIPIKPREITNEKMLKIENQMEDNSLVKIWIKESHVQPYFLKLPEVRNHISFLKKLKENSLVTNYVRNKISNRLHNLLLFYEKMNDPNPALVTSILVDLNRVLLMEDFYNEHAFSQVALSQESKDSIESCAGSSYDQDQRAFFRNFFRRNRLLFDDAFGDVIMRFGEWKYPISKKHLDDLETQRKLM